MFRVQRQLTDIAPLIQCAQRSVHGRIDAHPTYLVDGSEVLYAR